MCSDRLILRIGLVVRSEDGIGRRGIEGVNKMLNRIDKALEVGGGVGELTGRYT